MKRRAIDLERDYALLLKMQKASWAINFPGQLFRESTFRDALGAAVRRGEVYAYERGGELVGWLWMDFYDPASAHIRHLQVTEQHWGEGIGRRLVVDAIAMARAQQRTALTLNVTKANKRAVALYVGLGFTVVEDHGPRQHMRLELTAPASTPEPR